MDIKYLSKRYEGRKEWVESFFQTHHRYMETPSGLSDGHSLLAQFQSAGEGQRNPSPLHCCKSEGPRGCMEPRPNGFTRKNIFPLAFSARAISHMKPLADFKIQPRCLEKIKPLPCLLLSADAHPPIRDAPAAGPESDNKFDLDQRQPVMV